MTTSPDTSSGPETLEQALHTIRAACGATKKLHEPVIAWIRIRPDTLNPSPLTRTLSRYLHAYSHTIGPLITSLYTLQRANTAEEIKELYLEIIKVAEDIRTRIISDVAYMPTGEIGYASIADDLREKTLKILETLPEEESKIAHEAYNALAHAAENAKKLTAAIDRFEALYHAQIHTAPTPKVSSAEHLSTKPTIQIS